MAISAGASVATTASEERGLDGAATDALIDGNVRGAVAHAGHSPWSGVGISVRERRVLLTGRVATDKDHDAIILATAHTAMVGEILDAITVGGESDFSDQARDELIGRDLANDLLFDAVIKSINYDVTVNNRIVYLMGVAQSPDEVSRVMAYARNTAYVKKVVPLVLMQADPRRLSPNAKVTAIPVLPVFPRTGEPQRFAHPLDPRPSSADNSDTTTDAPPRTETAASQPASSDTPSTSEGSGAPLQLQPPARSTP